MRGKVWDGTKWVEFGRTSAYPHIRSYGNATPTTSATANTFGAWTEAVASTSARTTWIQVSSTTGTAVSNNNSAMLLDIGVGAAGNETPIVTSIMVGYSSSSLRVDAVAVVDIPTGSRIAIRAAGDTNRTSFPYPCTLAFGDTGIPGNTITLGDDRANTNGTQLAVPGTVGTPGAWTEIVGSTPDDIKGLVPMFQLGLGAVQNNTVTFDIAIGSSGNETPIIKDLQLLTSTAEFVENIVSINSADIPAGSRIAARYTRSTTLNYLYCTLLGVTA